MKKSIFIIAVCVLMLTSCTSSTAKKAVEETKLAIAKGDFTAALNYAELALNEGYKDDEFSELVKLVESYRDARSALDDTDPDKAEEIINNAGSFEGSGMTAAVDELKKDISKLKEDSSEFEEDIAEIEHDIEKERYYVACDEAKELLEKNLTKSQRERAEKLQSTAEEKKKQKYSSKATAKPTSTNQPTATPLSPKAILTEQEAVEAARKELKPADNAKVKVTFIQDYYQIVFTSTYNVDGEMIEDEVSCKVDARTGDVYDQAG